MYNSLTLPLTPEVPTLRWRKSTVTPKSSISPGMLNGGLSSLGGIHSCYILLQLVEEMATSAGLQCELDPVLCQALRVHKGA